jgi:NAD(P)-dependent dehydrogenase (short-subunit alcohol dehydrogenase family)
LTSTRSNANLVRPSIRATGLRRARKHDDRILIASASAAMAARLPSGRIGRVEDIAQAVKFLMKSGFVTGTVVDVDGGHRLV